MKTILVAVLALSSTACGLAEVKNPQEEQKAFYAQQNELRAQHDAARTAAGVVAAKEKNERLDKQDQERKAAYENVAAQRKAEAAAAREANERTQNEIAAQHTQQNKDRYLAKREAQEAKEAEEQAAVDAEIAQCRANPKCTWERVSAPLCEALANKRAYQQDMAKERANPSGIVNIKYLHDLGAEIQLCDANITMFRKDYSEQMHRNFNEGSCK